MAKVALIDFDGTICKHEFPRIGEALPECFDVLKEMKAAGWKLILWTCREDSQYDINRKYLKEAVEFCRQNGVEFDAVNDSLPEEDFRPEDFKRRKPYAKVHIDDRNLGGFPGWGVVRKILLENKPYTWQVKGE